VAGVRQQRERTGPPSARRLDDREPEGQERGAVQRWRVTGSVGVMMVMVVMVMVVMMMLVMMVVSHGR
jgi:hypothetical protein